MQYIPGQHALGAVSNVDIRIRATVLRERQVWSFFLQPRGQLLGCSNRSRRLEDDEIPSLQHRRDGLRRRLDVCKIGTLALRERCGHGDDERFCRLWVERRTEVPR